MLNMNGFNQPQCGSETIYVQFIIKNIKKKDSKSILFTSVCVAYVSSQFIIDILYFLCFNSLFLLEKFD